MRVSTLPLAGAFVMCLSANVRASEIFEYNAPDGSVILSTTRTDARFKILVRDTVDAVSTLRAPVSPPRLSAPDLFDQAIADASVRYAVDDALLHAIVSVESNYRPAAVSGKGAIGLMQLMPATARRYGVVDPLDPVQNIQGGARYLKYLLTFFRGDVDIALAAYNAGENAVLRHGGAIPPFRETVDYVAKVKARFQENQRRGAAIATGPAVIANVGMVVP